MKAEKAPEEMKEPGATLIMLIVMEAIETETAERKVKLIYLRLPGEWNDPSIAPANPTMLK